MGLKEAFVKPWKCQGKLCEETVKQSQVPINLASHRHDMVNGIMIGSGSIGV